MLRPPAFGYRAGELCCDRVPLSSLAARFGTPLYVYSARAIRRRLRAFGAAFRGIPHTVCYSVKANPSLGVLRLVAGSGAGFDVVSGGELERVLRAAPRAAGKIVFSGVGKTREEMELALRSGILLFNVESAGELRVLAEAAGRLGLRARVALRVNPNLPAVTHPYISTGLESHKFGVPLAEAERLYAGAARDSRLRVAGVSVHIGSQISDVRSARRSPAWRHWCAGFAARDTRFGLWMRAAVSQFPTAARATIFTSSSPRIRAPCAVRFAAWACGCCSNPAAPLWDPPELCWPASSTGKRTAANAS